MKQGKKRYETKKNLTCCACREPEQIASHFENHEKNEGNSGDKAIAMLTMLVTLLVNPKQEGPNKWILDSECTRHMTDQRYRFIYYTKGKGSVKKGNRNFTESIGYDIVKATIMVMGRLKRITCHNVLYARI